MCIMHQVQEFILSFIFFSNYFPLEWSTCSKQFFENLTDTLSCLLEPHDQSHEFEVSVCGNMIIEEDEECDCGSSLRCKGWTL